MRVQDWQNPVRNESDSGRTFGHYPPANTLRRKGLSVSIHVGTRKVRKINLLSFILLLRDLVF